MSIFGLHTQGEVDQLVARAVIAYADFVRGREAERVFKITPFPVDDAKALFVSACSQGPREAAFKAVQLVKQISDHYHKQLTPLQKELALVHQMYPEKIVLELEDIKTELADLRRRLCDRDTK